MLCIHAACKCRAVKIHFNIISAITVINDHITHEIRRNILFLASRPLITPPSSSYTYLVPIGSIYLEMHIKWTSLHLFPNLLWNCITLLACGVALGSEAVVTAPIDGTKRTIVLPNHGLHSFPVTIIGTWFISQFRHHNSLAVVGVKNTYEGAFENILLWNTENKIICSLTIKILLVDQLWEAIGIE